MKIYLYISENLFFGLKTSDKHYSRPYWFGRPTENQRKDSDTSSTRNAFESRRQCISYAKRFLKTLDINIDYIEVVDTPRWQDGGLVTKGYKINRGSYQLLQLWWNFWLEQQNDL